LKEVNFVEQENSQLEAIGYQAFCKSGIVSIDIPPSVTTIGHSVFHGNLSNLEALNQNLTVWKV